MAQEIIHGDCLNEMRMFCDNHFSGIVTDPPYGLHFMGKDWDCFKKSNFDERCNHKFIKPARTKAIRGLRKIYSANASAGSYDESRNFEFEGFVYEFAKEALRVTKPGGFLLMFGAPRRYHRQVCGLEDAGWEIRDCMMWIFGQGFPKSHNHFGIEGFGTALKPAYEPIIMAMKPLDGTFAQNAEKWGQAGINIDGCRVATDDNRDRLGCGKKGEDGCYGNSKTYDSISHQKGRWPANVILDEESGKMLDEMSGNLKSGSGDKHNKTQKGGYHGNFGLMSGVEYKADSGGASRFFYCAKASSSERGEDNKHPTVKPLKLMEYLLKLIAPPKDAIILDPFCGSGTTLLAAKNLGISAVGIEKEAAYCDIIRGRLNVKQLDFMEAIA